MKIVEMERITGIIDNRYEAVRVLAVEARRINRVLRGSEEEISEKPTSIAMNRLVEGKVKFRYEEPEEDK